jgi:uroporphyrinogen decarboxylase
VANKFPVDAINWHDQETPPTLAEANAMFRGGLLGGIDSNGIVRKGPPQEAAGQVSTAIKNADTALSHLIVAPACVIPIDTPVENIDAIIRVVKGK